MFMKLYIFVYATVGLGFGMLLRTYSDIENDCYTLFIHCRAKYYKVNTPGKQISIASIVTYLSFHCTVLFTA